MSKYQEIHLSNPFQCVAKIISPDYRDLNFQLEPFSRLTCKVEVPEGLKLRTIPYIDQDNQPATNIYLIDESF